jgi:protein-L-isoaspartate(D-aspartate) O-methyltransferase
MLKPDGQPGNHMVSEQIITRGIEDRRVIEAMRSVPRHRFVEKRFEGKAYKDTPLPIGYHQTISQPYIVAYMCERLGLSESSNVLEIGTGCGYQAAVLATIARSVVSLEIVRPLHARAKRLLEELGYRNVTCIAGDGAMGAPEFAPYDAIIAAAAAPLVPNVLDQLCDGGRAVFPIDSGNGYQELVLFVRNGASVDRHHLIPVRFVPMTGMIRRTHT